ncbi:universal stress protein [Cupriavidus sp. D39]|uniref:universal stress protein n=1 Tax=Cupriavidus sp. D39 TaxID=2997877 RepID=UPI00227130E8|nr:universal stress protein [Cupriavidus sp. D39]MCY0852724.1 universal stress protein [Cupriavidus sp. D39]
MYKVIMVAVDGSKCSTLALDEAVRMARACDADLEIIHVVDNSYLKYDVGSFDVGDLRKSLIESGQKLLAEAQATAHAQGVRNKTRLVDNLLALGDVSIAIEQAAQECGAELIVVGTHGRRAMRRVLLGSVAEALVRECSAPVLLVREPSTE